MRAFIALEIPPAIKASLEEFQHQLRNMPGATAVRWVNLRGMHLTLKFLGEIDRASIQVISAGMHAAVEGEPALKLELGKLGAFPNPSKPRVLWVGIQGDRPLLFDLQARIENALADRGFEKESRKFHPHLTLGRTRRGAEAEDLALLASMIATPVPSRLDFLSNEVILFESVLKPEGARYIPRARAGLGERP